MRLAAGALLAALALCLATPGAPAEWDFQPIEVTARPIPHFDRSGTDDRFGELDYRGGLVLTSPDRSFGSLSGLDIDTDGTLYAVADTGFWLRATLEEQDGRLVGLADAALAPIADDKGRPATDKRDADAEGLRLIRDATGTAALVSFERRHRVRRYALSALPAGRPQPVELISTRGLRSNRGIEAIAVAPAGGLLAGATVVLSERAGSAGDIPAWVLDGPRRGAFSVRGKGSFEITDAAFAPNGDLFVLERRFALPEGAAMRIRRMAAADIRPGATIDGPAVITAGLGYQIDNMEGLTVRLAPNGDTLLTLISDDNQSPLQRTLLLQFAWREMMPPLPRMRPKLAAAGSGG